MSKIYETNYVMKSPDGIYTYKLVEPKGEGGYADVWLAKRKVGNREKEVALKIFSPRRKLNQKGIENFIQEFEIQGKLRNKQNDVKEIYRGGLGFLRIPNKIFADNERPILELDYCNLGNAQSYFKSVRDNNEKENLVWKCIKQITHALSFLHNLDIY